MLINLGAILDKAEAFAAGRKVDPQVLLSWRLAPDMFPFVRQVQIAADFAKGMTARLAGAEVPKYDDNEKTFAELEARIMRFRGEAYLVHFALPNFYFHTTAAYAILRECGVELGKCDFLGMV